MSNNESLAHKKRDCTYHIVWIPKHRRKVLYGAVRGVFRDAPRRLAAAKDGTEIPEGGVCVDRMRMCLKIAPEHSVAKAVGYLEGESALVMLDHHPERRKVTGKDRTLWARGRYVSAVGINESVIRKYVRNQEDASRVEG